jgi:hypothetical protein
LSVLNRTKTLIIAALVTTVQANAQPATVPECDPLARGFLKALASKDIAELRKLAPKVDVFRITAPDETAGKTDDEILEMAKPLYDDLDSGFVSLIREAEKYKVDLAQLKFVKQQISTIPMTAQAFFVMEIFTRYNKRPIRFTVGIAYVEHTWYIYAIEQWEGIFGKPPKRPKEK